MSTRVALLAAALASCLAAPMPGQERPEPASAGVLGEHELQEIDGFPAQQQAERLLERAISRYRGALEQIDARLGSWSGKLAYSKRLESLIDLALNSSELRVRGAAVELTLASQGIAKDRATAQSFAELVKTTREDRPWRLWILSLLANRGVELDQARWLLLEFLRDPDDNTRQWAVNSLSMLGTDDIIESLLDTFGRDPSMAVRERAGCGLAESGMLTRDQRRKAIPGLIRMMDDPGINQETQAWILQALAEISGQHLGADRGAWRDWHARSLAAR